MKLQEIMTKPWNYFLRTSPFNCGTTDCVTDRLKLWDKTGSLGAKNVRGTFFSPFLFWLNILLGRSWTGSVYSKCSLCSSLVYGFQEQVNGLRGLLDLIIHELSCQFCLVLKFLLRFKICCHLWTDNESRKVEFHVALKENNAFCFYIQLLKGEW